ncbi:hypothetical protein V6N13_023845 [Hibiscus sabdariffa]|uniref:Uncharacterized protein n=1 Tax=Hibiscus sabdariffa TaxID=183260 RepID=A0ABR2PNA3_9ROSI
MTVTLTLCHATKPTVGTEETLLQKNATMTVVEDSVNTKLMDAYASSVTPVILTTDGEVVDEGEASAAVVTVASTSVTKGGDIAALEAL